MRPSAHHGVPRLIAHWSSAAFALFSGTIAAAADPIEDFYKGRQMTVIVGSTTGGIYDIYARLLAKYIVNYIPGKPATVIENRDGASGLVATNHVANISPRDGSMFAISLSGTPTAPLMYPDQAKFDAAKLSWIGSITKDPYVGYAWHTSPAQSYEEMKKTPIFVGSNSVGAAGVDMAILSNAMFGTKMRIITGYPGSSETKIALEKGEIDGTFANSWGDIKAQRMDWIRDRKIKVVIQHGFSRHKDLPDVPLIMDEAKNEMDRQALIFMLARQEFSKPFFAPPGVPAARLTALRRAFDATMKDKGFLADVAKANLVVDDPMTGEELQAIVEKVAATPKAVVDRVQSLLADFVAAKR